jgi:hypothetical protein
MRWETPNRWIWGVVDDTSTTGRSLAFPVVSVGPRVSPVAVATGTTPARGQVASACRRRQTPRPCSASRGRPGRRRRFPPSGPSTSAASGLPGCCLCTHDRGGNGRGRVRVRGVSKGHIIRTLYGPGGGVFFTCPAQRETPGPNPPPRPYPYPRRCLRLHRYRCRCRCRCRCPCGWIWPGPMTLPL